MKIQGKNSSALNRVAAGGTVGMRSKPGHEAVGVVLVGAGQFHHLLLSLEIF